MRTLLFLFLIFMSLTACKQELEPTTKNNDVIIDEKLFKPTLSGAFLSALFADRNNNIEEASRLYLEALDKDPGNRDLIEHSYKALLLEGKIEDSVAHARKILEKSPENIHSPSIVIIANHIKKEEYKKALSMIEPLIKQDKNSDVRDLYTVMMPLMEIWAKVADKNTSLKELLPLIKSLEKHKQFDRLIEYQTALIYAVMGKEAEAEKAFDLVMAKEKHPSYRLMEVAAQFYQNLGREEKVKNLIRNFIKQNPYSASLVEDLRIAMSRKAHIGTSAEGLAELFTEIATYFGQLELYDEALAYLQLSLYLNPDVPYTVALTGNIFEATKQHEEAIERFYRVSPESYFYHQARLRIAHNLDKLGRTEEAASVLTDRAAGYEETIDKLVTLGDIYLGRKKYSEAIQAYNKALTKLAEPVDKGYWGIFYARGIAFERSKEWEKAETDFNMALSLEPDQPEVLNYLAYSWLDRNQNFKEAEKMLARALKKKPDSPHIMDSYGWALFKLRLYKEALPHLETSVILMPHDPTVNDHLGDLYWKLGRLDEARYQWKRALTFNPEEEDIKKKIKEKIRNGLIEDMENGNIKVSKGKD